MRSAILTYVALAILLVAGCWAAWRAGSFLAGALAAVLTASVAAVMSVGGAIILFAIWHDAQTMSAIQASGGLGEVFTLPFAIVLPAAIVGTIGGAAAAGVRRLLAP